MHKDAPGPSIPPFEPEPLAAVLRPQFTADATLAGALNGLSKSLERLAAAAQDMRAQTQALAGARKQAEEERGHYQQLFESAPDGYFVTDAEGAILQANSTAARLLWIDLERLIGRSLTAFVVTTDRLRFRALLHRLKDPDFARRGWDWEIRFKSPGQPGFTGALNVTCEHDETGRLRALRWLVRDVSERKLAEAALKMREREQRAVAELGRIALTGAPFDALAAEAVALAASVLNMQYAALLELPPAGKAFLLAKGVGWKTELIGAATLSAETDGLWRFTLAADQPVCVEDAQTERRFRWPALLLEHGARSGVTVIVRGREHRRGLLGVYGAKRARFSSDDVHFLRSVANVLAAALERIEAKRALAEREAEIRLLTDSVPAMIAYVDSSQRYQSHNKAFESWLGVEVRGRHLSEVLGEELYQRVRPWVDQALAGQEVRYERAQLDRSGKPLHLDAHYVPHLAESGEVLGFFVLLTDITERKRMEEALRKSEQKLNSILSSLNDVVWSLSPQTHDLLYLSSAAARLYGHQLDEFFRDKNLWLKLIHPEDRKRVLGTLSQLLNEGSCEAQYRIVRSDGEIRWVHDRGWVVYDSDGKRLRLDGIVTDITDRKLKEEELASSRAKLRELSCHLQSAREDERTRIAREIHDELGSALTAIKMELAWCAKTRSRVAPKLRTIVDAIDSTIATVRRITTDLRPSILDHVGLTGAIEWQAQEFERRLKIPCRVEACEELGELDGATAIFRVVQEALTNVAQHSGATQVWIRIARDGGEGVIEVRDNGRGVSAEEIEKTNSFGLLGMSERTAALGGNITITGKPGVGTSVHLRFPLRWNGAPG